MIQFDGKDFADELDVLVYRIQSLASDWGCRPQDVKRLIQNYIDDNNAP
jgi:hypothetical protein